MTASEQLVPAGGLLVEGKLQVRRPFAAALVHGATRLSKPKGVTGAWTCSLASSAISHWSTRTCLA